MEQSAESTELETYNQFMKWLEEAKNNFNSWYDRQSKSKLVITATYLSVSLSRVRSRKLSEIGAKFRCLYRKSDH